MRRDRRVFEYSMGVIILDVSDILSLYILKHDYSLIPSYVGRRRTNAPREKSTGPVRRPDGWTSPY
jgi:hypothetical protein